MQRFKDQGLLRQWPAVHRHDDGGAQAVILVQPFPGNPVVDGAAEGGGEVLAEDRRRAVQDVADGVAGLEGVEGWRFQEGKIGAGVALGGLSVGAGVDRGVRGEGAGGVVVAVEAAHLDVGAPILVQVGDEHLHAGQGRVDVAVDRAGRGSGHGFGSSWVGRIGEWGLGGKCRGRGRFGRARADKSGSSRRQQRPLVHPRVLVGRIVWFEG